MGRVRTAPRRGAARALIGVVLGLTAVSAALSVLLAPGPLTYYGTHTRAYQLLAGAALALAARQWMARAPARRGRRGDCARRVRRSAGACAALVALANAIPDAQDYPGVAGLAVTAASVALIGGLDLMGSHPLRRVLGARLPALVGRLSYSLYLWHWPVIVFLPLMADRYDARWLGEKVVLVAAMTLLAVISYRLWEQPIRFKVWRRAPARRVVVTGLATSAALGTATILLLQPPSGFESRALASVRDLAKPGACPYFARDWPHRARAARACSAGARARRSPTSGTRTPSSGSPRY